MMIEKLVLPCEECGNVGDDGLCEFQTETDDIFDSCLLWIKHQARKSEREVVVSLLERQVMEFLTIGSTKSVRITMPADVWQSLLEAGVERPKEKKVAIIGNSNNAINTIHKLVEKGELSIQEKTMQIFEKEQIEKGKEQKARQKALGRIVGVEKGEKDA